MLKCSTNLSAINQLFNDKYTEHKTQRTQNVETLFPLAWQYILLFITIIILYQFCIVIVTKSNTLRRLCLVLKFDKAN